MKKKTITKSEREAYAIVGRKGGKAIAKKLGKKGMSELGKKGAAKRWPKKVQSKSDQRRRAVLKSGK